MNKKKFLTATVALSLSIAVGSIAGIAHSNLKSTTSHSNLSIDSTASNLEEEFWNVDLIVQGTVINQGETYQKDSGIATKKNSSFEVTPATIQISKVLYGNTNDNTITLLQHGSSTDSKVSKRFVKKSEDVVLILTETSDGKYWSYNFDDGIWKVKDGKVTSNSNSQLLKAQGDQSQDLDVFIEKITKAAKNKHKPNE